MILNTWMLTVKAVYPTIKIQREPTFEYSGLLSFRTCVFELGRYLRLCLSLSGQKLNLNDVCLRFPNANGQPGSPCLCADIG